MSEKGKEKNQTQKQKEEQPTTELDGIKGLLKSKFPNIKKMKLKQLKDEIMMWRNIWGWIPSEVKYYSSRTGQQVGIQIRNYKRFIGILLETYWDLREVEIGCYDKTYDQVEGKHYYERKIVKFPASQIVAWDWIAERIDAETLEQEEQEPTQEEQKKQYDLDSK